MLCSLHRFHWVAAIDTGQDCVMDSGSQRRSDLLAITPDLCLHWYSVCEGGGARDCEGMKIEQLATFSKDNLHSELRKLKLGKFIMSTIFNWVSDFKFQLDYATLISLP